MSLLYTMQGVRNVGHTCVVALARPGAELLKFYRAAGFEAIPWSGLALWDHSAVAPRPLWDPRTWRMLIDVGFGWQRTARRTLELVEQVRPDLVHMNSMVFSPSADALIRAGVPFVWHVREPAPDRGLRTHLIRRFMLRASHLIFISEFDRQSWVEGRRGVVIPNFIDLTRFCADADGKPLRQALHIPSDAKVILYLGGLSPIKGFNVLLEALHLLRERKFRFLCLMPGVVLGRAQSRLGRLAQVTLPLVGSGTPKQQAAKRIKSYGLELSVQLAAFAKDIIPFLAASDVVVFPSTKPHSARPVIEAGAMAKPVVASRIGGVEELVEDGETGLLVPPGDATALANALYEILTNETKARFMGEHGLERAKTLFNATNNVRSTVAVYNKLLNCIN
jgi:glycosyltransferase involved in cell wall biosynthesis